MKKIAAFLAVLLVLPALAEAHHYQLGSINIGHVWARATSGENGAVYVPLFNTGKEADALTGAETTMAERAEIHTTTVKNGVAHMERVDSVALEPGKTAAFKPGQLHVMLFKLKQPLKDGDTFPLTLHFAKAGMIEVEVHVQKNTPSNDELDHEHHH